MSAKYKRVNCHNLEFETDYVVTNSLFRVVVYKKYIPILDFVPLIKQYTQGAILVM